MTTQKTLRQAAVDVLRKMGPMHYQALTEQILAEGMASSASKTPAASLNAIIAVEIKRNGAQSQFIRVRPGVFGLRESLDPGKDPECAVAVDGATDPDRRVVVQEVQADGRLLWADLHGEVLGEEGGQALELLCEDPGGLFGRLREVRPAAAGLRHGGEQVLVEVLTEADRRRADALRACGGGHGGKLGLVRHSFVRFAVREEQDPSGPGRMDRTS